ncbi:translocation/assembly module TamB domain-containing protein [Thioclava pacifica]|uniref:Translocation and assembly module TamB C-terminal domain-containing protein n=1 Tax=Thioclava pacifica DSM 10166 TaxID=1353537 RepID=A0A074JY64_9RHOB|nr:translocation/assembly module TamB domain-containing protein [Thioclava pacifica]KEO54287.1 hypothetical protein TP2_05010 [Thioclava pacifica DSM 10166]
MRRFALLLALCLTPLIASAQDSTPQTDSGAGAATAEQTARDRSYLTGLIEDNLSGAGRTVRLDGFEGALSSRATFTQLTISDADGAWLTIKDGAIQWSRSALLTGKIEIDELSAAEIDLPRLPNAQASDGTPSPEAKPFALPELPVSVNIGKIDAKKVILGAPILGQAATVKVTGSMSLAGGEGKAKLAIDRIDGQKGAFSLTAAYDNGTRELGLDLLIDEGQGGIITKRIGLPGEPPMTLAVSGSGPIADFTADIVLSTQGQQRLAGQVTVKEAAPKGAPEGAPAQTNFSAAFSGDVRPLLPEDYRAFFGDAVALVVSGSRSASGQTQIDGLDLKSRALQLSGSALIGTNNMPEKFDLTGQLGLGDGQEVLLPLSGTKTWVQSGTINLAYDKAQGDGWKLSGTLDQLRREDGTKMLTANLSGSGRIRQSAPPSVGGTIILGLNGLEFADSALSEAVGPFATAKAVFSWQQDKPLRLSQLSLLGRDYRADANLTISDLDKGVTIKGTAQVNHSDISVISGLAGRPLSGQAQASVAGSYTVLTGAFDADLNVIGQDIAIDQPQADRALAGRSEITVSAKRDETGLALDTLNVKTAAGTLQAQGTLASKDGKLTANLSAKDLSILGGGYRGGVDADATVTFSGETYTFKLDGTGRALAIGQAEADKILAGTTKFSLLADYTAGQIQLRDLQLNNPQLDVSAQGAAAESGRTLDLNARLSNAALLAPGFAGPVSLSGTVGEDGAGYNLALSGSGPGGTEAKVSGRVSSDFNDADLSITGQAQTALINAFIEPRSLQGPLSFDLRLKGKPGLGALSGTVSATGTKIVAPNLGLVLDDVKTNVNLSGGSAQLDLNGRLSTGGSLSISGPVALSAPYSGNLTIRLDRARLRDPELYDTRASGTITMDGPLAGGAKIAGRITLEDTELRVPSSGLGGGAAVPEGMTHTGESAAVRQTLNRAGLLSTEPATATGAKTGPSYPLDVTIAATRGIFVRGRGLDAELGGSLRVTGTTSDVIPVGQFNLVRGRLDILGQRFTLDQGKIALQGALVPWLTFTATTSQDDYTISINIEGRATEPNVTFTSSPELPQDEVLARLIFGRSIENLSVLQAAQLASAVATLAGKGGEGIIGNLRKNFGLDDLDVSTDAEGNTQLKVGKYLTDNIYTDVTVSGDGTSQVNLNLDVTKNVTARGSVDSEGQSTLGVYFERNY